MSTDRSKGHDHYSYVLAPNKQTRNNVKYINESGAWIPIALVPGLCFLSHLGQFKLSLVGFVVRLKLFNVNQTEL